MVFLLGQKEPKKDYFKRKLKGQIRKKIIYEKIFKKLKRQKIKKKENVKEEKKKLYQKKKNKCPLFLILIHWIFEIIEYNLLCILM